MATGTCLPDWMDVSEFSVHADCDVHRLGQLGLRLGTVVLAGLLLMVMLGVWTRFARLLWSKTPVVRAILLWSVAQTLLMAVRPVLNVTLGVVSVLQPWMAVIVHASAAADAGLVVTFLFLEARLLQEASIKGGRGPRMTAVVAARTLRSVFLAAGILQAVLFLLGPLVVWLVGTSLMPPRIAFWAVVALVDFTLLPFFLVLTRAIARRLRASLEGAGGEMSANRRLQRGKLARRLDLIGVLCGALILFTGTVALACCVGVPTADWVLDEAAWISAIGFNGIIFWLLARKQLRQREASPRTETTATTHTSEVGM